jgi:hypothetical protein
MKSEPRATIALLGGPGCVPGVGCVSIPWCALTRASRRRCFRPVIKCQQHVKRLLLSRTTSDFTGKLQ